MNFDALRYRYPSRRSVIFGQKGMVCTSQPLAAQAGLDILKQGGNAIDAIIATAVCMTILEPTGNALGSDAFALIWAKNKLYGLNGSGPAPLALTPQLLKAHGYTSMPERGWLSVTVPGAPSAWAQMHKRFGRLPFAKLFEAAITYAEHGFPVQPIVSRLWRESNKTFAPYQDCAEFAPFFGTFWQQGAPCAGSLVKLPNQAKTLKELAATYCESYYRGNLSAKIAAFSQQTGGTLALKDLQNYQAEWVEPISTNYRGYTVCELPPNGHGLVVLLALSILKQFKLENKESAATVHKELEAMKLAFADGKAYIADPRYMKLPLNALLSEQYAKKRSSEIAETALTPQPINTNCGGTVYMCAADAEGNMVSFIQSNYKGFGSGIVIPETGIALNNRAFCFNLDANSANCLAPGKKPYHTIIPGFLMKDGQALGPFGVMGAFMQPQGQVQLLMNLIDFGLNPQEALDAPRWQWIGEKNIEVEPGFSPELIDALRQRGHKITINPDFISFGRGQLILRSEEGILTGATEPRADGSIAAW